MTIDQAINQELTIIRQVLDEVETYMMLTNNRFLLTSRYIYMKKTIDSGVARVEYLKTMRNHINQHLN